ncbi:MAG: hypothetical protein J1F23_00775 [Oscillospiraceae bacterium]|nr:hypothetical protein [Oscillospiraceae bacterium]
MKQKILPTRVLSVLLAVVMVLTSLPLMIASAAGAGTYDPAPYWASDDAGANKISSKEVMFSATLNADGTIEVLFPRAFAYDYNDGEISKNVEVQGYIVTLTEIDGGQTNQVKLIDMYFPLNMVEKIENASYPRKVTLSADSVSEAFAKVGGVKPSALYDIGITAVDNEYWVSETIHTVLNDIPYYNLTVDSSPDENWVAREMLNFEKRFDHDTTIQGGTISSNGTGLTYGVDYFGTDGTNGSANNVGINVDGKFSYMGIENSSSTANTSSFHFWVNSAYKGKPFSFTTTWSREHYNFGGAEEVWFYVDFRNVTFDKIAFNLRANEKYRNVWRDGKDEDHQSMYGELYSTKAVGGANEGTVGGIYIQNEMGLWEEITMTDGYLENFGGYRGFIRIPIDYFIIQVDQYITATNSDMGKSGNKYSDSVFSETTATNNQIAYAENQMFMQSKYSSGIYVNDVNGNPIPGERVTMKFLSGNKEGSINLFATPNTDKAVYRLLVNKAGTPISKCLLVQSRFTTYDRWGSKITSSMGYALQEGTSVNFNGTYNGAPYYNIDRANGASPLTDMVGAGIEIEGWSEDSVYNSFDFDQVFFMRKADANSESDYDKDTGEVLSSAPVQFHQDYTKDDDKDGSKGLPLDRGYRMANYYDRATQVPAAIAAFIDEYFSDVPSLVDYYTLEFIDNSVEIYGDSFKFPYDLERTLKDLGYQDAYNRYAKAKAFIEKYLGADANYYDLAWEFEERVELLPDPEFVDVKSPDIIKEVTELAGIYKGFDLDKLNFIGDGSELKFLQLYRMVLGDEVKTGQSVGAYPYIPFNNFDNNYYSNEYAFRYYNDGNYIWGDGSPSDADRNNAGNFTVYATNGYSLVEGSYGWYPRTYNPSYTSKYGADVGFGNADVFSRVSANITGKGYDGSHGATINLDGFAGSVTGAYNVLSVSYDGRTAGTLSALPGLDLSAIQLQNRGADGTMATDSTRYGGGTDNFWANSFVMYVDFSQVKNVYMNLQFIVQDKQTGADQVYYYAAGNANANDRIWIIGDDGQWKAVTVPQGANASTISTGYSGLQYYKGFIRIALSKFRTVDNQFLANNLDKVLIKRAHIAFWTDDNSNRGQSITVDGMGFTYDQNATASRVSSDPNADLIAANQYLSEVTNLDEFFAAKTDDSKTFTQAVYSLDPYAGEQAFKAAYDAARNMYNALSEYQQTLTDVILAKDKLDTYEELYNNYGLINDESSHWYAPYKTAAEIKDILASLPNELKAAATSKQGARMEAYNSSTGTINYSYFGLTEDNWEDIVKKAIEAYELGYTRLSAAEKAAFGDTTVLMNAYRAALRVRELNEDLTNTKNFFNELIALYTDTADKVYKNLAGKDLAGKDIPDEYKIDKTIDAYTKNSDGTYNTDELNPDIYDAMQEYFYMSIFAKYMITNSTESSDYGNMSDASNALLTVYLNARNRSGITDAATGQPIKVTDKYGVLNLNDGEIPGGIVYYTELVHKIHSFITGQIGKNDYINETELKEIEYQIRKFEAFDDCYQTVDSMYNEYLHMVIPFPSAELELRDDQTPGAADISKSGYVFTMDDETTVTDLTNQIYLPHVWARLGHSVTLQISSDLTMEQVAGETQKEVVNGEEQNKLLKFTVGQLNGMTPVEEVVKDGDSEKTVNVYYSKYIDNGGKFTNRYKSDDPARTNYFTAMQVKINGDDVKDIPTGVVYEGYITVDVFDTDDVTAYQNGTLKDSEGNVIKPVAVATMKIPVRFMSSSVFYEISLPAKIEVDFNALATEAPAVKVISILNKYDASHYDVLKVDLQGANAEHTMTLDTTNEKLAGITIPNPTPTIKYTVGGAVTRLEDGKIDTSKKTAFNTITVNGTGNYEDGDYPLSVWVSDTQWKQAYVNSYKDSNLTFTANYTAATDPNQQP